MLKPHEIDQLVSLTLADLEILTPEEYRAMSVEAQRQSLAGEPTNYEKILELESKASVAPIYWRFIGDGTQEQKRGFADYRLDGGVMFMSIVDEFTNVVSWDVVHLSIAELDADPKLERCNPEGTPLAAV